MRNPVVLRFIVLLPLLTAPLLLRAQFQNATPDELKMTDDPKSPGAAATYLNLAEVTDGHLGMHSFYSRIKVLTEKGESLATVELPYEKDDDGYFYEVAGIQGRTIHPDGSIVELKGKPADILVAKQGNDQIARKVFTLPDVTPGSIIEYYYQLRYRTGWSFPPTWHVQHDYYVHKSHYMYDPASELNVGMWFVLPAGVKVNKDALNRLSLDLADIPPAPHEDWMPPIENSLYQVEFYLRETNDPEAFWKKVGGNYSKSADDFANPSKELQAAVAGLIAPTDTPLLKAKKLYAAVQALDNTDYSREKTKAERKNLKLKQIKHAGDVWHDQSGNSTEMALLYLSMLKAAGLQAYAMRLVDRSKGLFTQGYMYYDQLDDTIVVLELDGKDVLLDPGEKMCPFQTVSWKHSAASGLRQGPNGSSLATTPHQLYQANTIKRMGELTVDAHGSVDGNLRIVMSGQQALYWRQKALEIEDGEFRTQFNSWVGSMIPDGVEAHVDHFIALDKPDDAFAAVVKVQGSLGTATSRRLLIPALFFETHGSHPFVDQDKRLTPVDMQYGDQVVDDLTYSLPAGLTVESSPQDSKVPWDGHAVLLIKCKTTGSEVAVTRTLARSFTFASTGEYQNLRDFYQKVAAADQQQIVLALTPPVKGN